MTTHRPIAHVPRTIDRALLNERLERDIAWLKRRNLWTERLFERAVARYVEANGSAAGLDEFLDRHGATAWAKQRDTSAL